MSLIWFPLIRSTAKCAVIIAGGIRCIWLNLKDIILSLGGIPTSPNEDEAYAWASAKVFEAEDDDDVF